MFLGLFYSEKDYSTIKQVYGYAYFFMNFKLFPFKFNFFFLMDVIYEKYRIIMDKVLFFD